MSRVRDSGGGGRDEGSEKISVIGGFGNRRKEDVIEFVRDVLKDIEGFKDISASGAFPTVVFAEFLSNDLMMGFVRKQTTLDGFRGFWADKSGANWNG